MLSDIYLPILMGGNGGQLFFWLSIIYIQVYGWFGD